MEQTIGVSGTPQLFIQQAIEKGLPIEHLEKLMGLQERWQANQARIAFFEAMSAFQNACPALEKKKRVNFTTRNGGTTDYKYAPLGEISATIKEALRANGLSYRWEMDDKNDSISCTCIVSHKDGHSEKSSMSAMKDTSGNKNEIQSRGSTITYLQRYTLIASLGISTADEDNDASYPPQQNNSHEENNTTSTSHESSGVSFKEFDPKTERITFGKNKGMEWITVDRNYLEWLCKDGKPESKSKAEMTLKYLDAAKTESNKIDDFAEVFDKKPEETKIEKGNLAIDDSEKKNKAMLAIAKATTKTELNRIAKQAADYADTGEITEETFKAIGSWIEKRNEDIKKGGK